MARPKKEEALNADKPVGLRITSEQRAGLEKRAKRNGHSLSDEIRLAIDKHLDGPAAGRRQT